jgi:hypothetical protein
VVHQNREDEKNASAFFDIDSLIHARREEEKRSKVGSASLLLVGVFNKPLRLISILRMRDLIKTHTMSYPHPYDSPVRC